MDLLRFLQKNKEARKIFGQRELKIIEKQLWGVNLTQSEKNRLSRDIRKKFEFISKVARFEDEFKLKKGVVVRELIEEAIEVAKESKWFLQIKKMILYGSSVENQRMLRSDIDIAVVFGKIDRREATKFRIHMSGRVNDRVDVQVYNILPLKITKEIDKKGKVIYERKN
jgi:predicted nucleotidyltransferase